MGSGTAKRSSHDAHRTSGDHETEWVGQTMSTDRPIRDTLSIRKHPSTKENRYDINPDFSRLSLALCSPLAEPFVP